MKISDLRKTLQIPEIYTIIMLIIYSAFTIILFSKLDNPISLILTNIGIATVVIAIAFYQTRNAENNYLGLFRKIYFAPIVYLIYVQVQNYVQVVNPYLFDDVLISWDYAIFQCNPTEVTNSFSFPLLTEILQICYMLYFVMPLMVGVDMHLKGNKKGFDEFAAMILFAFYLSYLMYFFMPAIGPRFTIHIFENLNLELPGLFLTDYLREIVNNGGGIPNGHLDPASVVNRDCMPSGHTWITLTNMYLSFKHKSRIRWFVLIGGTGLVFATVYLRYHYVVDVLAGIFFVGLTIWLEPKIRTWLKSKMEFKKN